MVMKEKLLKFIKKHGILTTIIQTGGYDNFNDIFPDYFKNRDHKVDLINAIVDNNEDGGYIYMYEIIGMDIKIWEEEIEDGHTQEDL